jgi:hypothetical protein
MIVLFLSGMVAMITMRTLYRNISNYNHWRHTMKPKKKLDGNLSMEMQSGPQIIQVYSMSVQELEYSFLG